MSKLKLDPRIIGDVLLFLGASFSAYYMISYMTQLMGEETKNDSKKRANAILSKLQHRRPELLENVTFDRYEQTILSSIIMPEDIKTSFNGTHKVTLQTLQS